MKYGHLEVCRDLQTLASASICTTECYWMLWEAMTAWDSPLAVSDSWDVTISCWAGKGHFANEGGHIQAARHNQRAIPSRHTLTKASNNTAMYVEAFGSV